MSARICAALILVVSTFFFAATRVHNGEWSLPFSSLSPIATPQRLAVCILVDPATVGSDARPGFAAAIESFARHYAAVPRPPFDIIVLYEVLSPAVNISALVASLNVESGGNLKMAVRYIDVSLYFDRALARGLEGKSCIVPYGPIGYRLMCRFMSGPVYWLPELDGYDQFIRLDEDSRFTADWDVSLELEATETYAFAMVNDDFPQCEIGFEEFVRKHYEGAPEVVRFGPLVYASPWVHNSRNFIYNCNFEVVRLSRFRSAHYRAWWTLIDESGLFMTTRLGDHQVKTVYLETFEPAENIVCYSSLPYWHAYDQSSSSPLGTDYPGTEGYCGGNIKKRLMTP